MPPILSFVYGLLPVLSLKSQAKFPTNGHDTDRTYAVFLRGKEGKFGAKTQKSYCKNIPENI